MHVKVTPQKDSNDAVFSIEVSLTNKSKKDMALLQTRALTIDMMHIDIALGEFNPQVLSVSRPPAQIIDSGDPLGEHIVVRIPPNKNFSFCVKSENFLLGATPLLHTKAPLHFSLLSALAWKRAAGYTTAYGYENTAALEANQTYFRAQLQFMDFGPQKFSAHRNRSCTKADALTK